ncbi:septum formation initiator family protein [Bifidobacterium aquikefiricola]|uniref:Septum formation initiator family protein n=1 Tax=Bifidobacterium aquikefiricola TaxID=3059038 RepID=A0AB39U3X7_9BIFI
MSKTSKGSGRTSTGSARPSQGSSAHTLGNSGPISFFIAMIIILLSTMELVSTFHTYAINLSELNGLRKQEASLVAQKKDLENQISRWNDKAYVTAQARERLGFVFPGEEAVRVLHPEAVTGTKTNKDAKQTDSSSDTTTLPWYSELSYAFNKADKQAGQSSGGSSSADSSKGGSSKSSPTPSSTSAQSTQSPSSSSSSSSD